MRHTLGTRKQFSNSMPARIAKAYFCIHCKEEKAGEGSRHQFKIASSPLKFLHMRTIKVLFCLTPVFICPLKQCLSSCLSTPLLFFPHSCCIWDYHWKTLNNTKEHIFFLNLSFTAICFLYTHTSKANNGRVIHQLQKWSYSCFNLSSLVLVLVSTACKNIIFQHVSSDNTNTKWNY